MTNGLLRFVLFVAFSSISSFASAQQRPTDVSACELAKDPKNFDAKLIRVRAGLNVYFEDFSLAIPNCKSDQGIWLAFGGDVPGIVASMVNDNIRKPGSDLQVNGVSYGLKRDDSFLRLYALISAWHRNEKYLEEKPAYKVTATLTGMFFAGEEEKTTEGGATYSGYGHLGCCSLLVITQVSEVDSVPPAALNVRGTVVDPDGKPAEGIEVIDDIEGGWPPVRRRILTDGHGEFSFSNSGQQLRIQNPNYRPLAITLHPGGAPARVKLEDANQSNRIVPDCGNANSAHRIGFSLLFDIPNALESAPFDDDDSHYIFVYPKGGETAEAKLIISRSPEQTEDESSSISSKWMRERWVRNTVGKIIGIDSRGQDRRGGNLRSLAYFGHDVAGYVLEPGEKPDVLDRVLDSVCLAVAPNH